MDNPVRIQCVFSRDSPPPFIHSADLLATDRVLLTLSPSLMAGTRRIRAGGFIILPGESDVPHYLAVLPLEEASRIREIMVQAERRFPKELTVVSRLLREWTRICSALESHEWAVATGGLQTWRNEDEDPDADPV